jgi:hypothetical protein
MFKRWRIFVAYGVAIPLALILGYLVSSPDQFTFSVLGVILFFFALPLFLRWHHALLIIFWNTAFNAYFLPGQPDVCLLFAALSFGISFLNHIVFQKQFLRVPELTCPLFFLAVVVLGTACCRGGIGIRSLGGTTHGGRYYVFILGAIIGYFALTAQQIPILKSRKMASLYFLSGTTSVLGNLAYTLGPSFFFLYYLVSPESTLSQVASDYGLTSSNRIQGLAPACTAVFCFLLLYYGIRELFDWAKPWRFLFLCLTVGASFFAGFRSIFALLVLIFAFQFYFEGLLRTHVFPVVIGLAICGFLPIALYSDRMPPVVQRAVSFLPVNVDAEVQSDAKASTDWRLEMWSVVWKDTPKYLIIGKGYSIDPTDMFLTTEAIRMGMIPSYEEAMLAGDYHSGPLSVLIPFGIPGALAFLWVLAAGGWVLYSNHRYGDARLRRINTLLLSYYLAYCVSFFFIFGAFNTQMFIFLGAAGLSVSLNGGVRRPSAPKRKRPAPPKIIVSKPDRVSQYKTT